VGTAFGGLCITPILYYIMEFMFKPYSYFGGYETIFYIIISITIGIAITFGASRGSLSGKVKTTPSKSVGFGSSIAPRGMMSLGLHEIEEKRKRDRANYPGDPHGKPIQTQEVKDLFNRAADNLIKRNFQQSKEILEEAIRIEPDVPELYVQLGANCFMLEEDQKGFEYLNMAIKLNPYHLNAYELLEKYYQATGQTYKEEEVFQKLKSFGPMYVNHLCDRGFGVLNSRDLSRGFKQNYLAAKNDFKRALLFDPNNKEANFFLNQIETFSFIDNELDKFKGDYKRAVEYYRNQLKLNPNDRRAFALLRMAEMRQLGLDF
jgi:tetratricopeptide (TPR) repeat protein